METQTIINPITQTTRPNFVSDNYGFVQTQPIVEMLAEHGWTLEKTAFARVKRAEKNGFQKHQLVFARRDAMLQAARDGEYPRMLLTNSHDRTSGLSFNFGWFRMACENGLIVGSALMSSFKVYHIGHDLETKVRTAIEAALLRFPEVEQTRQLMKQTVLTSEQIAELTVNTNKAVSELRGFDIQSPLYNVQRREDTDFSLWTVFNVLQEQSLSALTGSQTSVDPVSGEIRIKQYRARKVKSITVDQKINQAVFNEAYKMLKQAGA